MIGWWSPLARAEAWWDTSALPAGWLDQESIEAAGSGGSHEIIGAGAIATAFAAGSPAVRLAIASSGGIASGAAYGAPELGVTVEPNGIVTAQAAGSPTLQVSVVPSGIATGMAVGAPTLGVSVGAIGISTLEASGSPDLRPSVAPAGVAGAEAIGSPGLAIGVATAGVVSWEAFGLPEVTQGIEIRPAGVISAEAMGSPTVDLEALPEVIPGAGGYAGWYPSPRLITELQPAPWSIHSQGIASAEALGIPAVSVGLLPRFSADERLVGTPKLRLMVRPFGIREEEPTRRQRVLPISAEDEEIMLLGMLA